MTRRSVLVGRSRRNDVHLTHRSVSSRHAELIVADDGRIYITDCASRFGTHVRSSTGWREIRQEFVAIDDILRFGDYEIRVRQLLALADSPRSTTAHGPADGNRPSGPVARNPRTGEVVRKTS